MLREMRNRLQKPAPRSVPTPPDFGIHQDGHKGMLPHLGSHTLAPFREIPLKHILPYAPNATASRQRQYSVPASGRCVFPTSVPFPYAIIPSTALPLPP